MSNTTWFSMINEISNLQKATISQLISILNHYTPNTTKNPEESKLYLQRARRQG